MCEEKRSIDHWCNTCQYIGKDEDYCLACFFNTTRNIKVSKPKGYIKAKKSRRKYLKNKK